MKIAVVCAHFMPEIGYQEVYLARAFSRLNHRVRVFTSTCVSPSGKKILKNRYDPGLVRDPKYGFEILRLRPSFKWGSNVLSNKLKQSVLDHRPEIIVMVGVSKFFPNPLFTGEIAKISRMISIFGDAAEYKDRSTFLKKAFYVIKRIGFLIFKKRLFKKSVRWCEKIILNLPETETIFLSYLNQSEKETFLNKRQILSLGYDPDEFFFNERERREIRSELKIAEDEIILITSTRLNPGKKIEVIIDLLSDLRQKGFPVRYLLVGFLGDDYENILKAYMKSKLNSDTGLCFPFSTHERQRALFCAADIGIWTKAAISIQEAMGSGLPVIVEDKPSVNHIVSQNKNGWLFQKDDLERVLEESIRNLMKWDTDQRLEFRRKTHDINKQNLSYDNISRSILG